jgi:4-amino-4-deoxy-L-arabinose transferase-like glycosyltransferase
MSQRLRISLIILASAAVYLIGNDRVPLWDRDEPRNAQAARQMYRTGDWVVPRFLDKVRTAKPVFTYWCQAIAMHIFGDNVFAARLPSAVAMTLTLIVLAMVLTRYVDRERAFWTVFILASSAMVIAWSAKTSLTDSVLLVWIVIAELCLFAILRGNASWSVVIIISIAIGLAGLTKGPVVLGVLGMTLIVWLLYRGTGASPMQPESDLHGRGARATMKLLVATGIIVAIVAPWLYLVEHRAPGFIFTTVSHDIAARIFEPLEQHKGPPGYYSLAIWGIFFPWSVLLPLALVNAWRHRDDPRVRFALCATIGPWLLFECVQTKLPHYVLPIFPTLAFLTADAIVRCLRGEHKDLLTRGTRTAVAIWSLLVIALGAGLMVWGINNKSPAPLAALMAAIGIGWSLVVLAAFLTRQPRTGLLAVGGGMLVLMAITFGLYLPSVQSLRLSQQIAQILEQNGGDAKSTRAGDVQMIAYKEPSLAFYQGGTIREQSKNDFLQTHPPALWPKFIVVREDVWQQTPPNAKQQLQVIGEARGLDLPDRGRTWTVMVARKK